MAELARGRLRSKIPLLERALSGLVRDHHQQLLAMQLAHIDFRSYWIPGSWNLRMSYTDAILFSNP
jgi:hypothetical protein